MTDLGAPRTEQRPRRLSATIQDWADVDRSQRWSRSLSNRTRPALPARSKAITASFPGGAYRGDQHEVPPVGAGGYGNWRGLTRVLHAQLAACVRGITQDFATLHLDTGLSLGRASCGRGAAIHVL